MSRRTRLARKSVATASLSALMLAGLTGCGGDAEGETGDSLSKASFVYENVLTMCTDAPFEPFAVERNGGFEGFDIDLAQAIADNLDRDLDVLDVDFGDIESGAVFNDDQCDVAVAAITITGERARVVDFSSPYFDSKQALVAGKSSGISGMDDLAGEAVGVQAGTTGETFLRDFAPNGARIVTLPDAGAVTQALGSGEVSAAIFDNSVSGGVVKNSSGLSVVEEFETGEQYGMAVKKDGNIALLRTINDVLAKLKANGEYDKLYKKHF